MKRLKQPLLVTEISYAAADEVSRRKIGEVFNLLLRPQEPERGITERNLGSTGTPPAAVKQDVTELNRSERGVKENKATKLLAKQRQMRYETGDRKVVLG